MHDSVLFSVLCFGRLQLLNYVRPAHTAGRFQIMPSLFPALTFWGSHAERDVVPPHP